MNTIAPTDSPDDTRRKILDAAEARYRVYGYNKTTMVEIASDVGMSAANLYRYFNNKNDISAACAQRCMRSQTDRLREVVRKPGLTANQRLREYVLTSLEHSYENAGDDVKINELVVKILAERKDLVIKKVEAEQALIAEILAQGNKTGEFSIDDVVATARHVKTAVVMFNVPTFMGLYSLGELTDMANGVVDLILSGLNER